jgi:hypothetical protein
MGRSEAVKGMKPRAPIAPRAVATPAAPISAVAVVPSAAAPIPRSVDCKTVREILPPWEVLQDKLNKKN